MTSQRVNETSRSLENAFPTLATVFCHAMNHRDEPAALVRQAHLRIPRHRIALRVAAACLGALIMTFVGCAPSADADGFSGPLVITSGGTYSGSWKSLDSNVPVIRIRTSEPVVIENSVLRGAGHLIQVDHGRDAHLTVRNVHGRALHPTVAGKYPGRFLHVETYRFVRVENSYMEDTSGMYLYRSTPGAIAQVVRNRARNIDGRRADGEGGFTSDFFRVQFVQLAYGDGLVDSEIAWNEIINEPFASRVEDVISAYRTSGHSADDPVRIHNNFIRGAYPADPTRDYFSGGGIMLGDAGGAHLHAFENTVVSTANYGIAIAGGRDSRVFDNRVVSCGLLPDGARIASQNVGIYIWNNSSTPDFVRNKGYGNLVDWAGEEGRNDWWVPDAELWADNLRASSDDRIECHAEVVAYEHWTMKRDSAGVVIGPSGLVLPDEADDARRHEG